MTKLGEMTLNEALEHHGIRGMKWGRRKGSSTSSQRSITEKPSPETIKKGRRAVLRILSEVGETAVILYV